MHEQEVVTAGNSDCGPAMAQRTLDPLVVRRLPSATAANGKEPFWGEADPAGWDALIAVWWDTPPGGGPR